MLVEVSIVDKVCMYEQYPESKAHPPCVNVYRSKRVRVK